MIPYNMTALSLMKMTVLFEFEELQNEVLQNEVFQKV